MGAVQVGKGATVKDWTEVARQAWETRVQQAEQERDELRAKLDAVPVDAIRGLVGPAPATQKELDAWWRVVEAWVREVSA